MSLYQKIIRTTSPDVIFSGNNIRVQLKKLREAITMFSKVRVPIRTSNAYIDMIFVMYGGDHLSDVRWVVDNSLYSLIENTWEVFA